MTYYDFPARYWLSIQTTHPIEFTFTTIRHGTQRFRGCRRQPLHSSQR